MATNIVIHSNTYKARGCVPHRIVLAEKRIDVDTQRNFKGDILEYVTWMETFDENDPTKHTGYCWGHYFPVLPNQSDEHDQYIKACADYAIRAGKLASDITNEVIREDSRLSASL